ncbi:hypothetical protein H822_YJM1444O00181 [Saccharomyces cerevisiae YJM1444]|nr:hypothetical protein H822_YJM1444O00181 [Saccharomyces cerevisiae YJM1444]CAI4791582.1 AEH_G0049560.mRNA.1.CDS.1 [Saccharomyces cerevisiae]CAI6880978.1 AEH_G0049560.mRNA.1.CDS.1 [Saccharomyces cerevisiae]
MWRSYLVFLFFMTPRIQTYCPVPVLRSMAVLNIISPLIIFVSPIKKQDSLHSSACYANLTLVEKLQLWHSISND